MFQPQEVIDRMAELTNKLKAAAEGQERKKRFTNQEQAQEIAQKVTAHNYPAPTCMHSKTKRIASIFLLVYTVWGSFAYFLIMQQTVSMVIL